MNYDPMTGAPANNVEPPKKEKNTIALVALILSILGFNVVSLVLGILGLKKSRELDDGKGISVIAIVLSTLQVVAIALVLICGFAFTAMLWPEVKENIVEQANCSMAYDCEMINKSEYSCKYRDGKNLEQTITCPWTQVSTNQHKTTTITTKVADTKDKKILDDYLKDYLKKNLPLVDITLDAKYEVKSTHKYTLNGKNHEFKIYSYYNAAEEDADTIFTFDGKTLEAPYRFYVRPNSMSGSSQIKDIKTGKDYYLFVSDMYTEGGYSYSVMVIDDENNALYSFTGSGRFFKTKDDNTTKCIYRNGDQIIFYLPTENDQEALEVTAFMSNGELVFAPGNRIKGYQWSGLE